MNYAILTVLLSVFLIFGTASADNNDQYLCKERFGKPDGGMRAYWTFDDPTDACRDIFSTHHGVEHGDCTWRNPGRVRGCLEFDGVDDYIDCGYDASFNFIAWNSYSIAVWFLNDGGGDVGNGYGQKIMAQNFWSTDMWFSVNPVQGGRIEYVTGHMVPLGSYDWMVDETQDFRDGNWHFVIVTKNGTHGELWVDGMLKDTSENVYTPVNTMPLYIGFSPHPDWYQKKHWSGRLDEIAIFDRVLAPHEVAAMYEWSAQGLNYCIMGPVSVQSESWGRVKSLYR